MRNMYFFQPNADLLMYKYNRCVTIERFTLILLIRKSQFNTMGDLYKKFFRRRSTPVCCGTQFKNHKSRCILLCI